MRILAAFLAALLLTSPASAMQLASESTYAANNPVKHTDPNGMIVPALVVAGALVGIAMGFESDQQANLLAPAAGAAAGGALFVGSTAAGLAALPVEAVPLATMIGTTGTGVGLALADQGGPAAAKAIDVVETAAKGGAARLAGQTVSELVSSKGSFEKLIAEHTKKVADFKANPLAHDNKGILKNAPEHLRPQIIANRVKVLEGQIKKQTGELKKVVDELAKRDETKK